MKPETKFWQNIEPHVLGFKQRIESPIAKGIPDVFVCWKGVSYWIETKSWLNSPMIVRKEQWAWACTLNVSKGLVLIVAELQKDLICIAPLHLAKVQAYGKDQVYVEVLEFEKFFICTNKNFLQEALQKFLFT